jgi:hypothetical protein
MTLNEAIKVIEDEELNRYKKITFHGFSTNERGGIEIIETYKSKEDAISHIIEGLRVEKRLTERRIRKMKKQ